MEEQFLEWEMAEFSPITRSPWWYLCVLALGIVLIVLALWQSNFLFAVFVAIATGLVFIWSREETRAIEFAVSRNGVKIGPRLLDWNDLESFAVLTRGDEGEFILFKKHLISNAVRVPMPDDMRDTIIAALSARLPRIEYEESLPDALFRIIKF